MPAPAFTSRPWTLLPALGLAGLIGGLGFWFAADWLNPVPTGRYTDAVMAMRRRSGLMLAVLTTVQCTAVGAALIPRAGWLRITLLPILVFLGISATYLAVGSAERLTELLRDPSRFVLGFLAPPAALFLVHELALRRHATGTSHGLRVPYSYLLLGALAGITIGIAGGRRGAAIGAAVGMFLLLSQYYGLVAAMALGRRSASAIPDADAAKRSE